MLHLRENGVSRDSDDSIKINEDKYKNISWVFIFYLTVSWRRPLSYKNQSFYLLRKSMDWFLYDNGLRH